MNDQNTDMVVLFRTGQLFEIDMAAELLKERGIPCYTQQQTSSGLKAAMPAAPATGPGMWWNLLVPAGYATAAQETLENLSLGEGADPGVWGFQPGPAVKRGWKIYAGAILLLPLLLWLFGLFTRIIRFFD
ncbi:MAG TPA: DUF2007 domain-containing protein [Pontiella sp.]|nr:DUF2007 domain-containing protein [Pontiella sp.]